MVLLWAKNSESFHLCVLFAQRPKAQLLNGGRCLYMCDCLSATLTDCIFVSAPKVKACRRYSRYRTGEFVIFVSKVCKCVDATNDGCQIFLGIHNSRKKMRFRKTDVYAIIVLFVNCELQVITITYRIRMFRVTSMYTKFQHDLLLTFFCFCR